MAAGSFTTDITAIRKRDPATIAKRAHTTYEMFADADLEGMLRDNLTAERIVITTYQEIIRWLGDDDPTTRRLLEDILADEEELRRRHRRPARRVKKGGGGGCSAWQRDRPASPPRSSGPGWTCRCRARGRTRAALGRVRRPGGGGPVGGAAGRGARRRGGDPGRAGRPAAGTGQPLGRVGGAPARPRRDGRPGGTDLAAAAAPSSTARGRICTDALVTAAAADG